MSIWSLIKITIFLWLVRKTAKLTGWLLLAAIAIAAWPVTLVAAAGYLAAWLRGWPAIRLRRAAAWALLSAAAWLAAQAALLRAVRPVALAPVHNWDQGWQHLTTVGLARTFVLVAPVAVPAGLFLASLASRLSEFRGEWTFPLACVTARRRDSHDGCEVGDLPVTA